jgi:hypothetical protein
MYTAVLQRRQAFSKDTGIKIIHVLVYSDAGRDERIKQEEVKTGKEVKAFLRDVAVCV